MADTESEAGPVPCALVAATLKEYVDPPVRPVTVHDVDAEVHAAPPGLAVTVYEVIAEAPVVTGAFQESDTWPIPGVAAKPLG